MQAAEHLGTTQQAYSQALGTRKGMNALRCRIVEAFTPYRVMGPAFELVEKAST